MQPRGVIIFGTMGSGKDTLALEMTRALQIMNRACYIPKLGRDIRRLGNIICGAVDVEKPREYYQAIGQKLREVHEDIWNYTTLYDINAKAPTIPIIADGRQCNEFRFWKQQGFLPMGIVVNEMTRRERLLERDGYIPDAKAFSHDTELQAQYVSLNWCDELIDNSDTFEKLRERAQLIAHTYFGG